MIDPIKIGGWVYPDTFTPEQATLFQEALLRCFDAVLGGTFQLDNPAFFTGQPVVFTQRSDAYAHNWVVLAVSRVAAADAGVAIYNEKLALVVVGGDGVVDVSSDLGVAWVNATLGGASLGSGTINAIASNGPRQVVGFTDTTLGSPFSKQLAVSVDGGIGWARQDLDTGNGLGVNVVEYDPVTELFWAGCYGSPSNIETSPDGATWTTVALPAPFIAQGTVKGIAFSADRIVAVKDSYRKYAVSDDGGANWVELDFGVGTQPTHIYYDPVWRLWIASTNLGLMTSPNGDEGTWTVVRSPSLPKITKMATAPGLFMGMVGGTGYVAYSTDMGSTWKMRKATGLVGNIINIRYLPQTKQFMVIGTDCIALSIAAA